MPPNNPMSTWGNEKTMNLNSLILTNIQSSPYFKVNLFELKTYHEVIDEIYYKVEHLEPWEKGSRKTAGQTGMCGGVRGVGAGGIVSSAFCLLYKLFTLKLTKKQVIGLITHADSPYIRGLGFMYIRYTQPPADLWDWYEEYLDDEEEIDVKAGGGHVMTVGEMLRQWLVKLEWYSTLFPRIPVPIEKDLAMKLKGRPPIYHQPEPEPEHIPDNQLSFGEAERRGGAAGGGTVRDNGKQRQDSERRSWTPNNHRGGRGPTPSRRPSPYSRSSASRRSPPHDARRSPLRADTNNFELDLERERERQRRNQDRSRDKHRSRSREKKEKRSHSRDRKEKRSGSKDKKEKRSHSVDRDRKERVRDRKDTSGRERQRSRSRERKEKKDKHRERERDRDRSHRHRSKERDRERRRSEERDHRR